MLTDFNSYKINVIYHYKIFLHLNMQIRGNLNYKNELQKSVLNAHIN